MTYQLDRRATLVIDEPPYEGVEVEVRLGVGYGVVRRVDDALRRFYAADPGDAATDEERDAALAEEREGLDEAFAIFADEALLGWNLEDHRGAIPANAESIPRLPLGLARLVLNMWRGSIGMVSPPLARPSSGGEPRPTVTLSSLMSSPTPNSTDGGSDTTGTSESSTPKTPTDSTASSS